MVSVTIIGIGEDGLAGLSEKTRALIAGADLLCGGARHLALAGHGRTDGTTTQTITADLDVLLDRINAVRTGGGRVVVLASGDPLFFGIGAYLTTALGREEVEVRPSLASPQLAFARLGVPWHQATVLSVHGRPLLPVLGRALAATTLAFLTDERNTPPVVARTLVERGMEDAEAAVCERLGSPGETIVRGQLSDICARSFDPLNVLIVLRDPAAVRWGRPRVGLPDAAYAHARGMITKAEVRAVCLSRLGLDRPRTRTVWDVGAGSGSVAIEAASLRLDTVVYAVERDEEHLGLLRRNVRDCHAGNVEVVPGIAPPALTLLPDPDAPFFGGGGAQRAEVLDAIICRTRPGGRLVLPLVALDHLAEARAALRRAGWTATVIQVGAAREVPIGEGSRLAAINPVFILSAERPG